MKNLLLPLILFSIAFYSCSNQEPKFSKDQIEEESFNNKDRIAYLAKPKGKTDLIPIIVLGGSEGGNSTIRLSFELAKHGYAAFSLAYFAEGHLPQHLDRIPLEYFLETIDWIQTLDYVRKDGVVVYGFSKGAEATLLLASKTDKVSVAIAVSGTAHVWSDLNFNDAPHSSWTLNEKEIPFAAFKSYRVSSVPDLVSIKDGYHIDNELFNDSLARIKVEDSKAAMLLISGGDDQLLNSNEFYKSVANKLRDENYEKEVKHLNYPKAGHFIYHPKATVFQEFTEYNGNKYAVGGTEKAKLHAQNDSWPKILKFIDNNY